MSLRSCWIAVLLFTFVLGASAEEPRSVAKKEADFLGKNVTLLFHLEDSEQRFSVSTARQSYRLHSKGENAEETHEGTSGETKTPGEAVSPAHRESRFQERHGVAFDGEVSLNNDLNRVLVTCVGQFYYASQESNRSGTKVSEHVNEVEFEIDASALVTPGEPKVLVRTGEHVLTVTVTVEEK